MAVLVIPHNEPSALYGKLARCSACLNIYGRWYDSRKAVLRLAIVERGLPSNTRFDAHVVTGRGLAPNVALFACIGTVRSAPCTTFGSELVVLDTSTFPKADSSKLVGVLLIDPVYGMTRDVSTDGFIDRRKEGLFAEAREELEALQLILDRVLHFCEAQFNVRATQAVVEFG